MNSLKLKKGDQVMVITGKDKGKRGNIDQVFPKISKITVVGINKVKKHLKPSKKNPHGGIIDKIMPLQVSNVIIVCPRCSNPTRIGYKLTGEKKMRMCKKCNESVD